MTNRTTSQYAMRYYVIVWHEHFVASFVGCTATKKKETRILMQPYEIKAQGFLCPVPTSLAY